MTDLYDVVADERRRLADTVEELTDEQWNAPSLCAGWRTRDVFVHLLSVTEFSTVDFAKVMVRCGFNLNKVNNRIATSDTRSPAALIAALRSHADTRFHPPGFGAEAPLTDLTVHSGDILRPLGLTHDVPAEVAATVLDFLISPRGQIGFGKKGRLDGFSLRATDLDWQHGTGPAVSGAAESLIMMMTARTVAFDELEGDGVAQLRSRFPD